MITHVLGHRCYRRGLYLGLRDGPLRLLGGLSLIDLGWLFVCRLVGWLVLHVISDRLVLLEHLLQSWYIGGELSHEGVQLLHRGMVATPQMARSHLLPFQKLLVQGRE